jgi:hypothetical protein
MTLSNGTVYNYFEVGSTAGSQQHFEDSIPGANGSHRPVEHVNDDRMMDRIGDKEITSTRPRRPRRKESEWTQQAQNRRSGQRS